MTQSSLALLASRLKLRPDSVSAAVQLFEAGNTLPFVARYRKEATGGLDEEQLRCLQLEWKALEALDARRAAILKSLTESGSLTHGLEVSLAAADTLQQLEDLYLPHRPKRKTRASAAREAGLQPLADLILRQPPAVAKFTAEQLAGASDIVAETVAEHPDVRSAVRERLKRFGRLGSRMAKQAEDPKGTYANYAEWSGGLSAIRPHQILALDRGEHEKVLKLDLEFDERHWREVLWKKFPPRNGSPLAAVLSSALEDGARRLLLPAVEREVRREMTEWAQGHAVETFGSNLRGLLSIPPLADRVVLGVDPGFRTGCKLAVVDATGKVLDTDAVFLHQERLAVARLRELCLKWRVQVVAIGNGTASRETEALVAAVVRDLNVDGLGYMIVNEAGASVYSASPLARAELPELDVTLRGAVSIARRVLDPLAELVKIEPRSIGVGMYQHDLDAGRLDESLTAVVESVVNRVGVELNTASPALLTYVAGIGPKLAEKIVAHRDAQGPFRERKQLLKVGGVGARAFEQAAGFLRIREGAEPLDASAIHPESYAVARRVLTLAGTSAQAADREERLKSLLADASLSGLAARLEVGEATLRDILEQLARPGRDPRAELPAPVLRQDVVGMADLQVGTVLSGTVRNVVDFGAFVDVGVKQDGLLHRSVWPRGAPLSVGQVLEVAIKSVDAERGRISLELPG